LKEKGASPHEKTLNLTEQDTCNTSCLDEPEMFKSRPMTNNPNALPLAECKAILAGSIVLD